MNAPKDAVDSFWKRHTPTIACFNRATTPLDIDFDALIAALQKFVDEHVAPVWGTPAKLVKTDGYVRGYWAMSFFDHANHARRLAYHDLTPEGLPQSKVYVKTTLDNHKHVSMAASHELVEMLVDPCINIVTMKPGGRLAFGYESADPVEDLSFMVDGIEMTDFVYPSYFESFHKPGSVKFDHLGAIQRPFQIHAGGYQGVYRGGKWKPLFSSRSKQMRFEKEDRSGRRHEQRATSKLKKSSRKHLPPERR